MTMSTKTWTLLDVANDVHVDHLELTPQEVGGSARGYRVTKRTLRGGVRDGVETVEIDNGVCRVIVVPTRGMGVWRAWLGDFEVGWRSPVHGPVNPAFVPLREPSGLGWLSGFDELVVRCGLESNGGPEWDDRGVLQYPLHGKIANTPAHQVEVSIDSESGEIVLTGVVDETRLYHSKLRLTATLRMRLGEPGFHLHDTVENLSAEPSELEFLYHINFGQPLLDAGAKAVLPATKVVPCTPRAAEGVATWDTYEPPTEGYTEQVYFFDLAASPNGETQTMLRNAHGNQGVSLLFNRNELPCFTLWKSTQMPEDGYVTGLEPSINLPNQRSFEAKQGRVAKLAPHERREFHIDLRIHGDAQAVAEAEQSIERLRGDAKPQVFDEPQAGWSPA